MFRLVKSETIPLTRDLAMSFRDMEPSPTERQISPTRLKYLKERAAAKQLVTFGWARADYEGQQIRLNGQHSSTMLCDLDGEFPDNLYVHLDDYEVEGKAGLALLFRQFDARKSGRTSGDVAGAYHGLVDALIDVPRDVAKLGIEGYAWYLHNIEGVGIGRGDDVYDYLNRPVVHPFLFMLQSVFNSKTPELRRVAVVAAMYGTSIKSETGADEFWHQVARGGLEYDETAPSTVLDKWLRSFKEDDLATRASKGLSAVKPANFFNGCIFAWNAFRTEKAIKSISWDSKKGFTPINS